MILKNEHGWEEDDNENKESNILISMSEKLIHVSPSVRESITGIFIYQNVLDRFIENLRPENVPVRHLSDFPEDTPCTLELIVCHRIIIISQGSRAYRFI